MSGKEKPKGLPPLRIGPLATVEQAQELIRLRVEEEMRRMCELADRMGIPEGPSRWYSVAAALAREHVPELREAKPMGAPKKWGDFELGALYVELRRIIEGSATKMTEEQAAAKLSTTEPWRSYLQKKSGTYLGPDPAAALVKVYASAKKSKWSTTAWKAFQYHVHTDTLDEWTALVHSIGRSK